MRIESSVIGMDSARSYTSTRVSYQRFHASVMDYGAGVESREQGLLNDASAKEKDSSGETKEDDKGMLTKDAAADLRDRVESARNRRIRVRQADPNETRNTFRQYTLRYLFFMLFGEKRTNELFGEEPIGGERTDQGQEENQNPSGNATLSFSGLSMKTISLFSETYESEFEKTSFSSTGTVKTADGREISFNVELGMSREFTRVFRQELDLAQVTFCDPLVINFDAATASLSDQKFYFDIDADGSEDEISMLGAGSGYLALDKNGDGKIGDGSELFGPGSGNGFQDLAEYDKDHNGWIDENDEIWEQLKIWCVDENGGRSLYSLAEKGVGAISLLNVSTEFGLKDMENQTNGYIRSSGVFLFEDGRAGTVQHVDLAR